MNDAVRQLLEKNPTKSQQVPPIEIRVCSDTQEGEDAPATVCGWIPTPLEPPGPLALVLWKTNPEFRAAGPQVRRTILRDTILKLQVRIEKELKGHRWSRKRIQEQLAAQQSANASPPQDTNDLNDALTHLYEVQWVIVDEANKKVKWMPEDPRTWSASRPVWGVSLGSRAVYHNKDEATVANRLSQWVSDRDADGWSIEWPDAEGTLEEIRRKLTELQVGVGPRIEKPKKADYSRALGRAEAIRHLNAEFSGIQAPVEQLI